MSTTPQTQRLARAELTIDTTTVDTRNEMRDKDLRSEKFFDVTTKDQKGKLHAGATATATVDRKDFGLIWNAPLEGGGVMVSDKVELTVEVELVGKK